MSRSAGSSTTNAGTASMAKRMDNSSCRAALTRTSSKGDMLSATSGRRSTSRSMLTQYVQPGMVNWMSRGRPVEAELRRAWS